VAIWKIIYDYSSTNSNWASSTTGTVKWDATSTWGSEAVTDLGYALSPTSPVGVVGLESNVQNQAWQQPMIGGGPISMGGIGGPIVPEPTVLLSVLSLAGLVGVNKARKLLSK